MEEEYYTFVPHKGWLYEEKDKNVYSICISKHTIEDAILHNATKETILVPVKDNDAIVYYINTLYQKLFIEISLKDTKIDILQNRLNVITCSTLRQLLNKE